MTIDSKYAPERYINSPDVEYQFGHETIGASTLVVTYALTPPVVLPPPTIPPIPDDVDPYFYDVNSLLHLDDDLADVIPARAWTNNAGATLSAEQSKWGANSLKLNGVTNQAVMYETNLVALIPRLVTILSRVICGRLPPT